MIDKKTNRLRKFSSLKKSDEGVAGIIIAVLTIGLIITIIAVLQTVYVPDWMEQNEAEHMEEVSNQFSMLKYAIDIQSLAAEENSPISTSITLGSKELPFFSSNKAFGNLEIIEDRCIFTITDAGGNSVYDNGAGVIKYSSDNSYYMDQDLIYEAGAIISSQPQGDVMSIRPTFIVEDQGGGNYKILFKIVNIKSIGGKTSVGGYGTYPIQTDFSSSKPLSIIEDIKEIRITTEYQNSWELFLRNSFISAELEESDAGDEDFKFTSNDEQIIVEFTRVTYNIDIEITEIEINAQIAPGWIE